MAAVILKVVRSFNHALTGFFDMLRSESNARIHFIVTLVVLAVSLWLKLELFQFSLIVISIVGVWVAEALNTAIEVLAGDTTVRSQPIRRAKDIAAAAVLIASLGAAIIGCSVLFPPLFEKLSGR